jgi:hypothetical protein
MTTTRDFAVKFGRMPDHGLEGQKAFPFIYTFVNHNDDTWEATLTGIPSLANIGPTIPAGATRQINVLLDPDYNYKLLSVKYTAYYWREAINLANQYEWYEDDPTIDGVNVPVMAADLFNNAGGLPVAPNVGDTWKAQATANGWTINRIYRWDGSVWIDLTSVAPWQVSEGMDPGMDVIGTSLARYLRVTLSFQGSGSNVLYGGDYLNIVPNANVVNGRLPLPMEVLQGYDYGYMTTRTPYLLPRQGMMVFEVTNMHPRKALIAGAAIYGMKIRL